MKSIKCPHCGELISDVPDKTKDEKIKQLQDKFYDSLIDFVTEFGNTIVRDFYDYWSEPNRSKTKIKYQLKETWDTKRRLQRWKLNNFNNETNRKKTGNGFECDSTQRAIHSIENGFK